MDRIRIKEIIYLFVIFLVILLFLLPSILHAETLSDSPSADDLLVQKRLSIYKTLKSANSLDVPYNTFIFPRAMEFKFQKQWKQYLDSQYMYFSTPMGVDTLDGVAELSPQLSKDFAKNILGSVIKYHILNFLSFDKLNLALMSPSQTPMPTIITTDNQTAYTYFTPLSFTGLSLSGLFHFKNYGLKSFIYGFQVDPGPTMQFRHVSPIFNFTFGYNVLNGTKTFGIEKRLTEHVKFQASIKRPFSDERKIMAGISIEF